MSLLEVEKIIIDEVYTFYHHLYLYDSQGKKLRKRNRSYLFNAMIVLKMGRNSHCLRSILLYQNPHLRISYHFYHPQNIIILMGRECIRIVGLKTLRHRNQRKLILSNPLISIAEILILVYVVKHYVMPKH